MDRLDAMSVLLAVVEAGSLSAGARRLRVPLATISRKVGELEKHLGVRLLLRSNRGLALTEEGRTFVVASRRILEAMEAAERQAAGDHGAVRGTLHVTAPIAFGERHLVPVAFGFLDQHPDINLRLTLADRQVNLADEHVDVALRIGHLADSALIATRIGTVRRVICASPAYLARRGVPLQPNDLAGHDGISFQGFATAPEWRYRGDSAAFAVEPRAKLAVNTTEAAIQAALAGLGVIRVLSYQVSEHLRSGQLRLLLPDFIPEPLPVSLIYAPADLLPLKLRVFLDWTAPRLRQRMTECHGEWS